MACGRASRRSVSILAEPITYRRRAEARPSSRSRRADRADNSAVPAAPAGCSELIVNGGFESQGGWTEVSKGNAALIDTELPHTGKRSAWLGGTDQEPLQYIFQEVRIPANASSVKLSYYRLVHLETTGLLGVFAGDAELHHRVRE